MELAVGAARWVVGKALGPVTDGLLESWAASSELGAKIRALKMELLYAQGMLDSSGGRDIVDLRSTALAQLLLELRQLAYSADDVMDELEYFRIKDQLEGTYETTDVQAGDFVQGLFINAHQTARAVAGKLKLSSSSSSSSSFASREDTDDDEEDSKQGVLRRAMGKCLLPSCRSLPSESDDDNDDSSKPQTKHALMQAPKLKFNRVEISTRMGHIIEEFRPMCAKVSIILGLMLPYGGTATSAPVDRPRSTSHIIEPKIYGRENQLNNVTHEIVHGKYFANDLTVLPVLGVGGIGKTTFTQHLYDKVKSDFHVPIWVCVSHGFDAAMLAREILKQVPKGTDEKENDSCSDLIEKRLRSKRFLLVLDDVWTYHEDEWKKLLALFRNSGIKGNMVIVTTRIPEVAQMVGTFDCLVNLGRLDRDDCMLLFKACVFESEQSWESHVDLHETAGHIVDKLKGSPLAVRTVGRLLRNQLDKQHWNVVLESKEWELQTNNDDIMPALKLSYNFLPFYLQQCFSYCGLFPEDYKFTSEELIHFWIGLGLLDSRGGNKRVEDVGVSYLNTLVSQGFFIKSEEDIDHPHYVIHDLLHELAVNVSSYDCLSIDSSNVRSVQIPTSVRHLSVNVDNIVTSDRITFEKFREDLCALDKKLKSENLRTLMLFGEHHGSFAKTFRELFREAKALRVIFLSRASYNVEDLLHNFSNLLHLRYLRIEDVVSTNESLPSCITRFYHLMVLDVQKRTGYFDCVRYMSNLVKMRHFLVGGDHQFHSDIFEVGKLRFLQELRRFEVKKESEGFELEQLGKLLELRGSLGIYNLDKVESRREAGEAKLAEMNHLHGLVLDWSSSEPGTDLITKEKDIQEGLKPHSNLRELSIRAHPGTSCPTWLSDELSIANNLESLHLEGVAWVMLPLPGKQCTVEEHGAECPGCVAIGHSCFKNLKSLELVDIQTLKKWCGDGTCDLLPRLQTLVVDNCANLLELPLFSHPCSVDDKEKTVPSFPGLRTVRISNCPNLSSLPPIPWSGGLCSVEVEQVGLGFDEISYSKSEKDLSFTGSNDASRNRLEDEWGKVNFDHLTDHVIDLRIGNCSHVPLNHLQALACLESLYIQRSRLGLLPSEEGVVGDCYQIPVLKNLFLCACDASGKEITEFISHFPSLSRLHIESCDNVSGLGVAAHDPPEGGEIYDGGGLLLLPPEIEELVFFWCTNLVLNPSSLQGLLRLRSLHVDSSASDPSSSACHYFPSSLQNLSLYSVEGTLTLLPIPNLTSLNVYKCAGLTCEGVWPLLTKLHVTRSPKFFNCAPGQQDLRHSSRLEMLSTEDVVGALTEPICGHLSSSLTKLSLRSDDRVESFTVAQEEALQMLFSLRTLEFRFMEKLQCLPAVRSLARLGTLEIWGCKALRSVMPKDGGLPDSLKVLTIRDCPAIRSLPRKSIPGSLRELDVHEDNSKKLSRSCRRLKGIIPIIKT